MDLDILFLPVDPFSHASDIRAGPFSSTCADSFTCAQCLVGESPKTLRSAPPLMLARRLLEGLRNQGWLLDPSGSSRTMDLSIQRPSVEEALAAYVRFIAWVPSKTALTGSPDVAWLQPLLVELCSCLAASPAIGACWALRIPAGEAGSNLTFAARACAVHGQHLPAADLLRAYLRNVSREVRWSAYTDSAPELCTTCLGLDSGTGQDRLLETGS